MSVRFVKQEAGDRTPVMIAEVYAENTGTTGSGGDFGQQLQDSIQHVLAQRHPDVLPMVSVTVMKRPR